MKDTEHFFDLPSSSLTCYRHGQRQVLQEEISNKLNEWFRLWVCNSGISPVMPHISVFEIRRAKQILLCLAGCANRLHGVFKTCVTNVAIRF